MRSRVSGVTTGDTRHLTPDTSFPTHHHSEAPMPHEMRCPVRVNPLLRHPSERRESLEGSWQFRLDPDDEGVSDRWFQSPENFKESVQVPGCWQGQGHGDDSRDMVWDFRLEARVFQATYKGTGWYGRSFEVPASWDESRVWLNFGGAHPSAEVWLNGVRLGENDLPFVPFGFEVTDLARRDRPNWLAIRVHEKHREFGFAYSWQGNWSGLYRSVELTASGGSFIETCDILADVDSESLRFKVKIDDAAETSALAIRIAARPVGDGASTASLEEPVTGGEAEITLPVPSPGLWSPDAPDLYRVDVELLSGDESLDAMSERTGFVKLSSKGRLFLINGEPYYMRGSGDFISCPETGCPDTDRERWRRKLRALRDYGYNLVRCQSYVYPPEYFDAADEVGLLVQSEMGMLGAWSGHTPQHVYQWPPPTPDNYPILKRQWDLIVRRDVSHPSANIYCMSNELGGKTHFPRIAWQCRRDTRAIKPTAMVIWTDGGYNEELPGDFVNVVSTGMDATTCDKPIIEHEYRWWSSFPDVRAEHKYTGAVRPYAISVAREAAKLHGQEHLLETYGANSQRLQLLEAKAQMEICRRDRAWLAGICHFNAMDANLSPQGIIDEFYERKLADAATWLRTNGDTAVLSSLDIADRVLTAGEEFRCALSVSDFSHPAFENPILRWQIVSDDQALESGELTWAHEPYTTCPAGEIACTIPDLSHPVKARLEANLAEGGRRAANSWDIWLFPAEAPLPSGTAVYGEPKHTWLKQLEDVPNVSAQELGGVTVALTEKLDEDLLRFMTDGGAAVLAATEGLVRPHNPNFGYVKYFFTPPANYPPYEDGQNGTVITDHPVLGEFPHEGYADLQFFRMIDDAPPLDLEPLELNDEEPAIRVIHRYPVCRPLGYLLERAVGKGRLILCALQLDPSWPEARYLLTQVCARAANGQLEPGRNLPESCLKTIADVTSSL